MVIIAIIIMMQSQTHNRYSGKKSNEQIVPSALMNLEDGWSMANLDQLTFSQTTCGTNLIGASESYKNGGVIECSVYY